MHFSAPRTNPVQPNVKTSVSILTNSQQTQKTRPITPELPTVPVPMLPQHVAAEDTFGDTAEDTVEDDIQENNRMMNEAIMNMVNTIKESFEDVKDDVQVLPKTLLTKDQSQFMIQESISPKFINIHFIGEVASRVLFSTVHWVRQLSYFSKLELNNQIKILKKCWLDLFVLGLAQCQDSLHLDQMMAAVADNIKNVAEVEESSLHRVRQVTQNICKLKEYISAINKLELTSSEFGLLKIIAMFNTNPNSVNSDYYESISDRALAELRDQPKNKERGHETRYSKILLRLSPLRSLQEDVFEELFFGGLIGNVQIETVIPILLKMSNSSLQEYLKDQNQN